MCSGLETPEIPSSSLESLKSHCNSLDNYGIVALEAASTISRSVGIALALLDGHLSIGDALKCARVEEDLQIEEFGMVEGSHDIDEVNSKMILAASKNLVSLKSFS